MDLSKFNSRARAEQGIFVPLCDEWTRQPLSGTDDPEQGAPGFMVRGTAAPSVQSRMADMAHLAKEAETAAGSENKIAAMERVQREMMDAADKFIIHGVNLENEGTVVFDDRDEIRKVLNMTFPQMKVVKDEDGNVLTTKAKDKDGQEIEIPKFEMSNWTFSQQVIEAGEDGTRFLASPETA